MARLHSFKSRNMMPSS